MKPRKVAFYYVEFQVIGSAWFPVDMLRYDSCCPATSEDAAKIEHSRVQVGERPTVSIRLRRFGMSQQGPTAERWRSFGWVVSSC